MIRSYLSIVPIVFIAWMTGCSTSPRPEDYKIAIGASKIKQPGILVMKSDAMGKKQLVSDPTAQLITASWSPDGNKIAFLSTRPSDSDILKKYQVSYHYLLYEIDVASGKEKRLLNFPVSGFRWSPDGKRMLFISSYEDPGLVKGAVYIFNLQTGEQKRVTSFGQACYATWSPDGKQIAFSMGTDQSSDVYVMNSDGQSTRCLTDSKSVYTRPEWSPDGKAIVYVAMNPLGAKDVEVGTYIMNPDGANKKLLSPIMAYGAIWSPDGKSLLILRDGGASLTDSEGKKSVNIASEVGYPQDLVFTPDGKKIVFRSNHEGDWHIYYVDTSGARLRRISDLVSPTFCLSPAGAKP
jgi:Tol biopolymer transport system component